MKEEKPLDRLSPENLMNYHLSVSLVNKLYDDGEITAREKSKMLTILGDKYGIDSCSIFAA